MVRITIGLILIIGFIQSLFLNNQVIWNGYMLIGAAIPMVIGLILIAFGLRKKWSDIKKELTGWGNERISTITKVYFSDFDAFLDKYIAKSIPHFALLCMGFVGIVMISANPLNPYFGTWLFWPIVVLLAPLYGLMAYFVGGFFYQIIASICGAKWNPPLSRKVFIYALLPSYLAGAMSSLFFYFVYHTRSLDVSANKYSVLIWSVIMLSASIYAFMHSNKAAKKVLNAKPIRSFIFFLLIPILLNAIILSSILMKSFGYTGSHGEYRIGIENGDDVVHGLLLEDIQNEKLKEAQIKIDKGDINGAEKIYLDIINNQKQVASNNELMEAYISLSSIYLNVGRTKAAIDYVNEALSKTDDKNEAYYMLKSLLAIEKSDVNGLVDIFTKILEINPNNIEANIGLGRYYLIKNPDYEKALIYNKKAHEIKKTIEGLEMLAMNYYLLNSFDEAKIYFEELYKVAPDNTIALLKLGELSYGFGNLNDAIKYFSELKKVDPSKITPQIEDIINEKI